MQRWRTAGSWLALGVLAGCGGKAVANGAPDTTAAVLDTTSPAVTAAPLLDPGRVPSAPRSAGTVEPRPPLEDIELDVAGVRRTAVVARPASPRPGTAVVVILHGRGGNGRSMLATGLHERANAAGALAVLPDALGASWNDDRPGLQAPVPADDVGFLDALVDHLMRTEGVDGQRVVVAGFSNGGLMTSRYACERAVRVVAAVIVGAAGPEGIAERCRPGRVVPILIVSGTADEVVPYAGGAVTGTGRGTVASAAEVLAHWSRVNGCDDLTVEPDLPVAEVIRATGCDDGGVVEHHRLLGGTHVWLRDASFDTTAVAWSFAGRFAVSVPI